MKRALVYCAGGGIGDSLMASVVARALRERYEVVDALTLPGHRATLERVPDLDAVLVDNGGSEGELVRELVAKNYDAGIVTWATARTAKIPQAAKIPIRVGQARRLYSHRFTHQVTVRSELGDVVTPWPQILLDYARAIECDTPDIHPKFEPTTQDSDECTALLVTLSNSPVTLSLSKGYLVLHPTNAVAPKRGIWPTQGWAKLARSLAERFDLPVLLTGATSDDEINAAILSLLKDTRIINVAGKLGIGAFGALAARSKAFIGITTGTTHVAAAVGAPTIGIYPFQSDVPERWGPQGRKTAIVRASFPCHPGDTKEKCPDYACIANLDVPRVIAAVEGLLKG